MLKTIIIEDQAPAQNVLRKYMETAQSIVLDKVFYDTLGATSYLEKNSVDLIFLDINLPRVSGIEFLKSTSNLPMTILTTAHAEFALECYQYNVVDYLLKPFSLQRFMKAVDKVVGMTRALQQIPVMHETQSNRFIVIKSSHELLRIRKEDILFIKSDSDYTEIITFSGKYLTSDPLREWNAKLSNEFRQVHKSYIINISHLKKMSHSKVLLSDGQTIPIGRAYKRNLLEHISE